MRSTPPATPTSSGRRSARSTPSTRWSSTINAQSGIGVTTRRVFNEAGKAGLGRFIAINKMDADNIDFTTLVKNIQEMFGKSCQLLNVPLGRGADFRGVASTLKVPADTAGALVDPNDIHTSLIESIIEVDEEVMTRYFDGVEPSDEELARLIVHAVAGGTLIPIVCCSAKTGVGVKELLDALVFCGLPPNAVHRTAVTADEKVVDVTADPDGPLVAQIFKTRIDPFVQKLSFIRIYSGTLEEQRNGAGRRDPQGREAGPVVRDPGRQDRGRSTRPAPARSWP